MELLIDIKKFPDYPTIIRASGVKISDNQNFNKMKKFMENSRLSCICKLFALGPHMKIK